MSDSPPSAPSTGTSQALPRTVWALGLASLLNDIASEMIFPLLPQFLLLTLHGSRLDLGLIEGFADTTASALKLISGAWSDRLSRRRGFVLAGYVLAVVSRPLIGAAAVPWHVFALRTADRVGKGIRTAPRDALIADAVEPGRRGRAFGFHRAMDHLGAALGPLVASAYLVARSGADPTAALRTLFFWSLVPGVAVLAIIGFGVRESPPVGADSGKPGGSDDRAGVFPTAGRLFTPEFRRFLIAVVLFTLGNSSDAFLLVRAGELGVPLEQLPILWCLFHLAKTQGNLWAGRLVDRVGPRPLILSGWMLYALVYLGFAWASQAWQVWGLFLAYSAFYALTEPAEKSLTASLATADQRGRAFGWFHGAIGLAALPASLLFGGLYDLGGPWAAFGTGAVFALLGAATLATVRSR